MLTAEGFWPVAPVWGRSEEERLLLLLPVACPVETFGVIQSSSSGLPAWVFGNGFHVLMERMYIYFHS
jgi:hypothetical protein